MGNLSKGKKFTLYNLTWPIFIEILLFMMLGTVDTLMLSRYSDNAVAGVGVSNQILWMINMTFGAVAAGTSVLSAQYLGAKEKTMVSKITLVSLLVSFIFGIIISSIMFFAGRHIISLMKIRPELMEFAVEYLQIVGGFIFLQGILMTITAVARSHGYTKVSMYITFGINVIHVFLDYILIFGIFGAPALGVKGAAIANVLSKFIGLIVALYILFNTIEKDLTLKLLRPFPTNIVKNILKIGVPSAGEQFSYNMSQLVITYFINMISSEALITKTYVQNIIMFVFLFAVAIGQGTEIFVGHLVGEGKLKKVYEVCIRSLKIAITISLTLGLIVALFRNQVLHIFTENKAIISIGGAILIIDAILEPGRAFNLVVINCLRAAGDVKFPVYIGMISMWGVSVTLSYFLGIYLGFGLIGMWIAFSLDEWLRGILMLWRWSTKKWETMSFVKVKNV